MRRQVFPQAPSPVDDRHARTEEREEEGGRKRASARSIARSDVAQPKLDGPKQEGMDAPTITSFFLIWDMVCE